MAKLRPRARIIRTIGDQLISGPEAALIELVKNAYDADSPSVLIKMAPALPKNEGGTISIVDLGHGMSSHHILNNWLEPATDEKAKRRISPGGRVMLGAKGIGRFAASRLGRHTKLETVYEHNGAKQLTTVTVDWEWFDSAKYLDQVDIPVYEQKLSSNPSRHSGVELTIWQLRDEWTKRRLEILIRELRRLASPAETLQNSFKIRLDITAFTKETRGFEGQELLTELNLIRDADDEDTESDPFLIRPFGLQKAADYILKGKFDSKGHFDGSFTIYRGDKTKQHLQVSPPALLPEEAPCGPFQIQINVYDREREAIEALFGRMGIDLNRIGILNARRILTENAGISIFRKGFRIRPYGEPDNDWLELERQRVQDPSKKLGLSQVSGAVTIADEDESELVERSSREGLEHNAAYERLKSLMQNVLLHVEERRFQFREKAGLSRRVKGDLNKVRQSASLKRIVTVAKTLPSKYRRRVEIAVQKDSAALVSEIREIDEYQQALESRAALGLVVAEVLHEGRRLLNPAATSAKTLWDSKDWILEESKRGMVFRRQFPGYVEVIYINLRDLGRLFKKLDPISGRKRGKPRDFLVAEVIDRCLDLFKEQILNTGIRVYSDCAKQANAHGYEDDLQAAVMNIIDNAIHWLSTKQGKKELTIICAAKRNVVEVSISNNGPIIDEAYIPRLFDAGFTLKTGGTGLGLAIAREAVRRSKGTIIYDENAPNTTFLVQMPLSE